LIQLFYNITRHETFELAKSTFKRMRLAVLVKSQSGNREDCLPYELVTLTILQSSECGGSLMSEYKPPVVGIDDFGHQWWISRQQAEAEEILGFLSIRKKRRKKKQAMLSPVGRPDMRCALRPTA